MKPWLWYIVAGMGWYGGIETVKGPPAVMTVNGEPITRAAFTWYQDREKAGIVQAVFSRYGLPYGTGFWQTPCDDTNPGLLILDKTVEVITRDSCERQLFRQLGLIADSSYEYFLDQWYQINDQRQESVRRGEVVYGPVQYSLEQYYGHWMARLRIQAREWLAQNQLALNEHELRVYYETSGSQLFRTVPTMSFETISVDTRNDQPEAVQALSVVRERLMAGMSGDQIKLEWAGFPSLTGSYARWERCSEDRLAEQFTDPEVFAKVKTMAGGQMILLADTPKTLKAVRCIAIHPALPAAYHDVRDRVRDLLIDQRYQSLLDARVSKAMVTINRHKPQVPAS